MSRASSFGGAGPAMTHSAPSQRARPFASMLQGAWLTRAALGGAGLATGGLVGFLVAYLGALPSLALVVALAGAAWFVSDAGVALVALVAVICLLPFAVVPVRLGAAPTFLDTVIAGLLALWLVRWWTRQDSAPRSTPINLPLLLYLGVACAGFVGGTAGGVTGEQNSTVAIGRGLASGIGES